MLQQQEKIYQIIQLMYRSDSGSGTQTAYWNFGNGYFGTTAISSEGTNIRIGKFEYDV